MTMPATLEGRMEHVKRMADAGAMWWIRVLEMCGGNLEGAARYDLATDGDFQYIDLRFKPFNTPELRARALETRQVSQAFRAELIDAAWREPEPDES